MAPDAYPSRIPPLPRVEWDERTTEALSILRPPGRRAPQPPDGPRPRSGILEIFARHPDLAEGWMHFNNHLFHSTLTARVRELVTVRIAWLRRGEYEWAQHVRMAKSAGMTDEEIAAISVGPQAPVWAPVESALLRAVDELCHDRYVSDETWAELAAEYDHRELMDVVFTVGCYDILAMAMNTFGLQVDAGLQRFPAEA